MCCRSGNQVRRQVRIVVVPFLDLPLASGSTPGPNFRSYWVVEDRFAAGAYPSRSQPPDPGQMPDRTAALLDAGITCFVNLTEDQPGSGTREETFHHYQEYVDGTAVVLAHPIVDVDIPTVDEMIATLDVIDDHLDNGGNVYVHCWGGKGRTGTVVGCWLVRHGYGRPDFPEDPIGPDDPDDVIAVLQDMRRGDLGTGDQPSPDTADQEAFIRSWEPGM